MAREKIKLSTDQRSFTMIYNDFLESKVLKADEKMLFIILKRFSDGNGKCFPSLSKLADITGYSKRKVQDLLKELEKKKIIEKECRKRPDGGYTSNLYTLYDYSEIWNNSENSEEIKKNKKFGLKEIPTELLLSEIKRRKKEPASEPTKDQTQAPKQNLQLDDSIISSKSQEKYTIERLKSLYHYDIILSDYRIKAEDADAIFYILYDTINSEKKTVRIEGTNRPLDVVKSKLTKLNYEHIVYVIEKYSKLTGQIRSPKAYILSMLYNAKEQMHFEYENLLNNTK